MTVLSPTIALEAGEKGEIKMHAKNITIDAEEEIKVTSVTKSIALTAEKDITMNAMAKTPRKRAFPRLVSWKSAAVRPWIFPG